MDLSRRQFLGAAALASLSAQVLASTEVDPKTGMPTRLLGKTGARVSILAMGAGSRWLMYRDEQQALQALDTALAAGVTYLDSAAQYGNGESERRLGVFLKERRKQVWLTTKISERGYDEVMRMAELSLKRLQTTQVDLLHMHSLSGASDLAAIEAPNGALKAMYKLRDEKVTRFLGVTSHTDPATLRLCLERHDLDCTQMALNAGRIGAAAPSNVRGHAQSFEETALPVALAKGMGVTAMKVYAQDKLLPDATPQQLVRYALTLPVAAAVVGMPKPEHIRQNLEFAKAFQPYSPEEMRSLSGRLAAARKTEMDEYFAHHVDACDACGITPA
ncbi:MAG: aldo/keto reductase [Bryobacterales bacterium]|jgi:hypothetical protein|nr:aldo/keto reductase [Bryobacterales bacterium]